MGQLTEAGTSRFAQVREGGLDLKLHYNDAGAGDVVIMLHGSGAGASGWSNFSRNVDAFVAAGYRVLLPDCPGWNKSDPIVLEKGSRGDVNAAAIKGLMDVLAIERAHVVGNSMGGLSTLSFALTYPERLSKAVIMGGAGVGPSLFTPLPAEGIKLLIALYMAPTLDNLKRMLDVFVYDSSRLTEELIQERYESMMLYPQHLQNFAHSFKVNSAQFPDLSPRLGEIAAPTLVTWGRDDRFVPLDWGLRMIWLLQNADMHIFSHCGHWAQWEHADAFNALVLEFLAR